MPMMVKTMVQMNIGQVHSSINNMDDSQIEKFLDDAFNMLEYVRYGEREE